MLPNCDCNPCCMSASCGGHDKNCIFWELKAQADADAEPCSKVLKLGDYYNEEEYCDNDRVPGTKYCIDHQDEEENMASPPNSVPNDHETAPLPDAPVIPAPEPAKEHPGNDGESGESFNFSIGE